MKKKLSQSSALIVCSLFEKVKGNVVKGIKEKKCVRKVRRTRLE